jgi:hypothetical protein
VVSTRCDVGPQRDRAQHCRPLAKTTHELSANQEISFLICTNNRLSPGSQTPWGLAGFVVDLRVLTAPVWACDTFPFIVCCMIRCFKFEIGSRIYESLLGASSGGIAHCYKIHAVEGLMTATSTRGIHIWTAFHAPSVSTKNSPMQFCLYHCSSERGSLGQKNFGMQSTELLI